MILFDFADIRKKGRWAKTQFDIEDGRLNVNNGLNLGGKCQNIIDGQQCNEYNVVQIGMLQKSEKQEDVHKLKDVKKIAFTIINEKVPEERKFFDDQKTGTKCSKCQQILKTAYLTDAIFYNCKYEVKFVMKMEGRKTDKIDRKGIIAHQNNIVVFDQNIQKCHGIMGSIQPLTREEFRNETLCSWLWENDF